MIISNAIFPHKNIQKQTWVLSDGRRRNRINLVVVYNKIKICVMDIQSLEEIKIAVRNAKRGRKASGEDESMYAKLKV